ncbi:MAG TPA: hypothetical protein PK664_08415, partial [Paludibacteraceae bacterium]|nr:hypothetical protein [Paludibacteraceae bacterium]HPS11384.1 hypothetical protein [Paludibacteraceae bacterium]
VVSPGLEPGQAEPKTAVLPLHHETIIILLSLKSGAKIRLFFVFQNNLSKMYLCRGIIPL